VISVELCSTLREIGTLKEDYLKGAIIALCFSDYYLG
jgi:hypothetical protein